MDFNNQDFKALGMAEAVAKTALGKPVFILTRLYQETTVSQLAGALGFVECREKQAVQAATAIEEKPQPQPKKPGPKKKALPAEPEDKEEPKRKIDVGKIRACYEAHRDPDWIAGEMGLTRPEVVVILKDMEIYRGD